jgi:hypothetical protein
MNIKSFIKEFIPPIFWKVYKNNPSEYGFFGNYPNWEAAMKDAEGYDKEREHLTCAMSINAYSSQKLENLEPDHKEK